MLLDHATLIYIKTHSQDPVLFTIAGSRIEPDGVQSFDEAAAKEGGYEPVEATGLVGMMKG
jgi:2,3-bisphosphoglycerate-independent phosphoglycerate mutase